MRCAEKVAAAYRQGHRDGYESAREDGWMEQGRATADALDAAREAVLRAQDVAKSGEGIVVNITLGAGRGHMYVNRDAVLAAIDGLKEKP